MEDPGANALPGLKVLGWVCYKLVSNVASHGEPAERREEIDKNSEVCHSADVTRYNISVGNVSEVSWQIAGGGGPHQ